MPLFEDAVTGINLNAVQWTPSVKNDGTRESAYGSRACLSLALERPGPTPDNKDALHNVNNIAWILVQTYYQQFDLSKGIIQLPARVSESIVDDLIVGPP